MCVYDINLINYGISFILFSVICSLLLQSSAFWLCDISCLFCLLILIHFQRYSLFLVIVVLSSILYIPVAFGYICHFAYACYIFSVQFVELWYLDDYLGVNVHIVENNTHTRLTALFLGLPRWAGTRKVLGKTNLDFTEAREWVAMASAGPYASLHILSYHLAPDRQPHQHPTTIVENKYGNKCWFI